MPGNALILVAATRGEVVDFLKRAVPRGMIHGALTRNSILKRGITMTGIAAFVRPWRLLLLLLCCCSISSPTHAAERVEVIGVVTAEQAKIMDAERVMTTVPKGTRLWVFNKERTWLEIKIPGTELHGWINRSNIKLVELTPAEQKRENDLIAMLVKGFELKKAEKFAEARAEMTRCLELMRPTYDGEPDIARVLHELGGMDMKLGDFPAAKKHLEEALAIRQKFLGDYNEDTGLTANSLGLLATNQNDYATAKKHFDIALAALRFRLGNDDPNTGAAINNLGLLAVNKGDYPEAEKLLNEYLALIRKKEKTPGADTALALNNIGQVAQQQGKYTDAKKHYDEALKILTSIKASETSTAGILHNNIALMHAEQGEFALSKQANERALAIRRKILGNNNPELALTLINLADTFRKQSDYTAAKELIDEALALTRKTVGENDARTALAYNALGNLAQELGDFGAAREHYQKNLTIRRALKGDSPLSIVTALNNVGESARSQGDYPTARKFLEEALALSRKTLGDNNPQLTVTINNLGSLAFEQGDLATARKLYEESLALIRKTPGGQHPELPTTLTNLAALVRQQGDLDGARQRLDEALALARKIYKDDHPQTAGVLLAQANLATIEGKTEQAHERYNDAISILRKALGDDHPTTASAISNQGELFYLQKDFRRAWERFDEALNIRRRIFGENHPATVGSLELLAGLAVIEKEYDVAQKHLDEARRITRRYTQYLLPALAPREQLQYLENRYLSGLFMGLSFGLQRRDDPTIANLAAGWLINGKAIAQESLAARELLARDLSDPQLAPLVLELQAQRRKMATLSLSAVKREQQAAHQAEVTATAAAEYRLAQELSQRTGTPPENRDWVELNRFRRALRPEAVYVDLVRTLVIDVEKGSVSTPHYLAWIIPAHGQGAVQILDLGEAQPIDDAISAVRMDLKVQSGKDGALLRDGEAMAAAATAQKLRAVADLVLQPLLPKLGSAKQLILSPDGALWLLPWAALPVDDEKLLLEKYTLQYVLSGREVLKLASKSKNQPSAPAIFFNPNYDQRADAGKAAVQRLVPGIKFDEVAQRSPTTRSSLPRAEALPNTALEGLAAAPLLRKIANIEPKAFQGDDALETVAKRLKRPRHLLFATHGFFLEDQNSSEPKKEPTANKKPELPSQTDEGPVVDNPLLRCGLLLAGCNSPRTETLDDGILTGLEIVGMDLRGTELVVLSACDTGFGRVLNGEGVAGLRQSFQLAGAQSVVSTLWQVPDRDSALVMQDFFTNLAAGQSKGDALRNAQLKRIAARKEKSGAAHPFFWAAWTVTGE